MEFIIDILSWSNSIKFDMGYFTISLGEVMLLPLCGVTIKFLLSAFSNVIERGREERAEG